MYGDEASSLSSAIAKCCEVVWVLAERVVHAALGDPARDRLERLAALVGEVEGDDRLVGGGLVEALLRVLDVRAGQARAILGDPPAVGLRVVRVGALLA